MDKQLQPDKPKILAKFHIGLSALYLFIFLFFIKDISRLAQPVYVLAPLLFFLMHAALCIGVLNKLEVARKISEWIGALMLIVFPIGTILAFYYLPNTQWAKPEDPRL